MPKRRNPVAIPQELPRTIVGRTVRYSGYALQGDRNYWLGLGDYTRKNAAKAYLDRKVALRGIITDVAKTQAGMPYVCVRWANSATSHTAPYMLCFDDNLPVVL